MIETVGREGKPIRLLMIGSGRRAQQNYMPALNCLTDMFQIVAMHSRTEDRLRPVADKWGVPAAPSLSEVDFSKVDVVAVSVPTAQNAVVLEQLKDHAAGLHLVIDTPVSYSLGEYEAVKPLLPLFRSVTVTEDYMNFPTYAFVRKVVRQGLIGEVKGLLLENIGYLYHGLALIRSFVDFDAIKSSRPYALGSGRHKAVSYFFDGGMRATVIGPYRGHRSGAGSLVVEGAFGSISENAADQELNTFGRPSYLLRPITENGAMVGCELVGGKQSLSADFGDVRAMREMDFEDKSDMNLLRGSGLAEVFRSVAGIRNINKSYGYQNALYDSFASKLATEGRSDIDPLRVFSDGLDGNWKKDFAVSSPRPLENMGRPD